MISLYSAVKAKPLSFNFTGFNGQRSNSVFTAWRLMVDGMFPDSRLMNCEKGLSSTVI